MKKDILHDIVFIIGFTATLVGAAMVYAPSAWIVGGVTLAVFSIMASRNSKRG